jgi:hypothetical protein
MISTLLFFSFACLVNDILATPESDIKVFKMCILPERMYTIGRNMPLIYVNKIEKCKADEICMRNGTDDTSQYYGIGLG